MAFGKKKEKEKEPGYINSPINNPMLNYKIYFAGKAEKLYAGLVIWLMGGFVSLVFYGGLFKIDGISTTNTYISNIAFFIIVGLFALKFFYPLYIKRQKNKRQEKLKIQFRDMLESLASSFSSGSNVNNAFEAALADLKIQYSENDYIIKEMQEILNGINQNVDIDIMLKSFAERSDNDDIMCFADVFGTCYHKGGNMRMVIHRTRIVISEKIAIMDEIETKLTSNKMQHNVMSLMPIAIVALLRFTNKAFAENFATPIGVIVNTIAIGIFVIAYIYGQKIVDIKD